MGAPLSDATDRLEAVTTFDRNVVVVAGAGTGKTALLTARAVVYLLGESYEHRPARDPGQRADEVLALTFTEKAASEMAERIIAYLRLLADPDSDTALPPPMDTLVVEPLQWRYRLDAPTIRLRASDALEHVERITVSTIHAFCSSLIRRYPLEAGVSPSFVVDTDGSALDEVFERVWQAHVCAQLGSGVPGSWRVALEAGLRLSDLEEFARAMVRSRVPTDLLLDPCVVVGDPSTHLAPLIEALPALDRISSTITGLRLGSRSRLLRLGTALPSIARAYASTERAPAPHDLEAWEGSLEGGLENLMNRSVCTALERAGLRPDEFATTLEAAIEVVEEARAFTPRELAAVHEVCAPVVREVRAQAAREGILPFEHLLLYAARLVSGHKDVARRLRERYRCVLLDEVQDTDPLQYDVIRPLREEQGSPWGESGTFVVGDPKQSIYLFRDADIRAFAAQAREISRTGRELTLWANFRSDPRIVAFANAVCRRLFTAGTWSHEEQPPYIDLASHLPPRSQVPPVEIIEVAPPPEAKASDRAQVETAVAVRRLWRLRHEGYPWGDIVVLVPTRTGVEEMAASLQEAGIPCVLSGGRTFYSCQEVLDTVHLLSCLVDPQDKASMVAFLGSRVAGVDNETLLALCTAGLCEGFTFVDVASWTPPASHPALCSVREPERAHLAALFSELARLRSCVLEWEAWEAFQAIRTALPVAEAWAFGRLGPQRMANVDKVLDEIEAAVHAGTSLAAVVRQMRERVLLEREAEEGPMASPTMDAVRIETIHGAKGLEFPVVVLANLFRTVRRETEGNVYVAFDWATRTVAARVGPVRNHAARQYHRARGRRRSAELARLLYVALTRAKERLVLLLHPSSRDSTYSRMVERSLAEAVESGEVQEGSEFAVVEVGEGPRTRLEASSGVAVPLSELLDVARRRREALERVRARPARLAPSADEPFSQREIPPHDVEPSPLDRDRALRFGDLCHAVLEHLDLRDPLGDLAQALASPLARRVAGELYDELVDEARAVLEAAVQTPFFRSLGGADEVLRELPVLEEVEGATLSGRIDLAARWGESWLVVDFKTDQVIASHEELAARYGGQKAAYTRALRRALGLGSTPRFALYFLRHGVVVEP